MCVCMCICVFSVLCVYVCTLKEELLTHERILLQTIKFDLMVEKPYQYILSFGKKLISQASKNSKQPEKEQG